MFLCAGPVPPGFWVAFFLFPLFWEASRKRLKNTFCINIYAILERKLNKLPPGPGLVVSRLARFVSDC